MEFRKRPLTVHMIRASPLTAQQQQAILAQQTAQQVHVEVPSQRPMAITAMTREEIIKRIRCERNKKK
jgi:hypothetical protein